MSSASETVGYAKGEDPQFASLFLHSVLSQDAPHHLRFKVSIILSNYRSKVPLPLKVVDVSWLS